MFNLFKKTYKPLAEYPGSWSILEEKNKDLIIRVNTGLKDATGHTDYPIKVGVAIPVKAQDDINSIKNAGEDALDEIWKQEGKGVIVAVITGMSDPRFIELLSYAKKDTDFASLHKTLKDKFPNEDVQMYANEESNWDTYKSFLK
ncbi:MAG: hypothetical protein A2675_02920 [Candidatus Yonathbacteria bacterium RIFCSPHIGHO2_01_FULL_51_10]|uniref:DUF695 domain-containing protein n=1 Tax=Candidatus Yonathbacteria bacterium RIFCSPHIGHO2_01_FULL_51_10 TaxID=1802723 RepID=A0A1G2S8E5_9BACT|nr:MAG: hypothetical protein A2675_02920 [Candidatus Yonathbacteria bacterium RIFCSPHIGHO2_01_FULL_51_10]